MWEQTHLSKRQQRQRIIRRRRVRFASILLTGFLVAIAYVVMSMTGSSTAQVQEEDLLVDYEPSPASPVSTPGLEHPVFTRFSTPNGESNLLLPVAAEDVSIIAYHSLSGEALVPMMPIGSQLNRGLLARNIERFFSGEAPIRYYIFDDEGGAARTAGVDIGAPAGSSITSPVTGEVTGVASYYLYGKYEDVQVDIRPAGMGGATISMLFVEEPTVEIGESVEAGETRIGKVRAPQGELGERLAKYTHDSGAHVHLQVSETPLE